MVMLLAGEHAAQTEAGRALVARLDLSSGAYAASVARAHFPEAAARIRLRKALILKWLQELHTAGSPASRLLIVPGAGLGPLGVDWCALHSDARAIELDYEHVDAKRTLIAETVTCEIASRVGCLQCDLRDLSATRHALESCGMGPADPAVWVIEGLSYYLPTEALEALVRLALAGTSANRVILEFSLSREVLSAEAAARTLAYHQFIAEMVGQRELVVTDIDRLARETSARVAQVLDPAEIEAHLGWPPFFRGADDSSMRIALLAPSHA